MIHSSSRYTFLVYDTKKYYVLRTVKVDLLVSRPQASSLKPQASKTQYQAPWFKSEPHFSSKAQILASRPKSLLLQYDYFQMKQKMTT